MRILVITPWARTDGGAEVLLWNLLTHLDRTRLQPSLAVFEPGPLVEAARAIEIPVAVHPSGRLRQPASVAATVRFLARLIDEQRPDILINWHGKGQLYGAAARGLARHSPTSIWWQHMIPDGHWLDRIATALPADGVGTSSHAIARAQRQVRPRRRTFVVHPGTPDPGIPPDLAERSRQRARFGIPPERRVIVIVGRLQPWKGQDHFIGAISRLRDRSFDVHGIIVGGAAFGLSSEYAESLPGIARRYGLEDRMLFTGQIADVTPYIRCADALVNASDAEPFGNVLIEGMSHGVPVVAAATGGPLEIIEDGVTGILAPTAGREDLADALARLICHEQGRVRIATAGRERFLEAFTASRMAERLTAELEQLTEIRSS